MSERASLGPSELTWITGIIQAALAKIDPRSRAILPRKRSFRRTRMLYIHPRMRSSIVRERSWASYRGK